MLVFQIFYNDVIDNDSYSNYVSIMKEKIINNFLFIIIILVRFY